MIPSRKAYQYKIVQFILSADNNPTMWDDDKLSELLKGEVVIGYLLRSKKSQFSIPVHILNLYTIKSKYVETPDKVLKAEDLKNVFLQWLDSLVEDSTSIMFRNPPIKEWMDTKENWCKKLAHKCVEKFNLPFDECLSTIYLSIVKCYNKGSVYMGNLSYIETAAKNDLKLKLRFWKNRLTGDSPNMMHLDAKVSEVTGNEDDITTFHELIGKEDPWYKGLDFECVKDEIISDLKEVFSKREIDQIINMPGYLPMSLYRKLNKWRKTHKRSDYNV